MKKKTLFFCYVGNFQWKQTKKKKYGENFIFNEYTRNLNDHNEKYNQGDDVVDFV